MSGRGRPPTLPRAAASLAIATALVCSPRLAAGQAEGKHACFAAHEQAQLLRKDARLKAAREALYACSAEACPAAVRADCTQWLGEVESSVPTVLFEAREANGRSVTAVRVLVDGRQVADQAWGKPIELDPGEHLVHYETDDGRSAEERIDLRAGEKSRPIGLLLPALPTASTARRTAPSPAPAIPAGNPGGPSFPPPAPALVLGGVGVAAAVVGSYLGITGLTTESALRKDCAPGCPQEDEDALRRRYLFADLSFGLAIVSVGAAVVITLLHRAAPKAAIAPTRRAF